jgi:hypothetical protein
MQHNTSLFAASSPTAPTHSEPKYTRKRSEKEKEKKRKRKKL